MAFEQSSLRDASLGSSKLLGQVLSCRGSEARVGLPSPAPTNEQRATVGKFIAIRTAGGVTVGMITEVTATTGEPMSSDYKAVAKIVLMGEIAAGVTGVQQFQRGVRNYPAIGDEVELIRRSDLRLVYSSIGNRSISIGQLHQDASVPAHVDVDNLLNKHFAVLGSTGVGKSSGVTVILTEMIKARPDVKVLLLDVHNEYGRSFGDKASVIGAEELRLPFWLLNFEEFSDVVYEGKPSVPEELQILAELIPAAKSMYQNYKGNPERVSLARRAPKNHGFSADTPSPYLIQDLLALIDERMGKLENRSNRLSHNRLMMRIESIHSDPRYAFMFENANVGGDTMASVLNQLFRLETQDSGVTVLKLASLPGEAVDAVVCVVARLAFEFGLWSDGGIPLLLVCEEAHRYASTDHTVGFAPARRALSRIAKEGRKYGVHIGLVTQRPAELDPTIISQCSTLFIMRMANDEDHSIMRSASTDATASLLSFVPSLSTGEVIGIGEGMPLAARFTFRTLPQAALPASDSSDRSEVYDAQDRTQVVKRAIERWRRATMGNQGAAPEHEAAPVPAVRENLSAVARGLQSIAGEREVTLRARSEFPLSHNR